MKKIDSDGLSLCSLQGNVFASSLDYVKCSSEIFMRRFMTSQIVKEFDSSAILDDCLTLSDIFQAIEDEYGASDYGKIKYEKEVLFWIGYIYRYFAYTYELSSKYIYKIIKPKQLNEIYYVYHIFDPAMAIERILEEKGISFDIDDQNEKLLKMLRKRYYEQEVMFKKEKDSYVNNKKQEERIVFAIEFKQETIGQIVLKRGNNNQFEIEVIFNNDCHINKGIDGLVIEKSIIYAKKQLQAKLLVGKVLKDNENNNNLFKNLGFDYFKEDEDFAYYEKRL